LQRRLNFFSFNLLNKKHCEMQNHKNFEDFYNTVKALVWGHRPQHTQDEKKAGHNIDNMQHIFVLRHGMRADDDRYDRGAVQRTWDPPLSDRGRQQVYEQGAVIQSIMEQQKKSITRIVSSPFTRCLQTSDVLAERFKIHECIKIDNGVSELMSRAVILDRNKKIEMIRKQGLVVHTDDIPALFSNCLTGASSPALGVPVNQTETDDHKGAGYARFKNSITRIADEDPTQNIVIVTHWDGVAAAVNLPLPGVVVLNTTYGGFIHLICDRSVSEQPSWKTGDRSDTHGVIWGLGLPAHGVGKPKHKKRKLTSF
jgi:broad specificity phosphatase PhoE